MVGHWKRDESSFQYCHVGCFNFLLMQFFWRWYDYKLSIFVVRGLVQLDLDDARYFTLNVSGVEKAFNLSKGADVVVIVP